MVLGLWNREFFVFHEEGSVCATSDLVNFKNYKYILLFFLEEIQHERVKNVY